MQLPIVKANIPVAARIVTAPNIPSRRPDRPGLPLDFELTGEEPAAGPDHVVSEDADCSDLSRAALESRPYLGIDLTGSIFPSDGYRT